MERGKRDETKRGERGVCSDTTRWGEVVHVVSWKTGPALPWPVGSGLPSERPPDSQSPQTRNLNTKTHTHSEVIDSEFAAECVCEFTSEQRGLTFAEVALFVQNGFGGHDLAMPAGSNPQLVS